MLRYPRGVPSKVDTAVANYGTSDIVANMSITVGPSRLILHAWREVALPLVTSDTKHKANIFELRGHGGVRDTREEMRKEDDEDM
jgi:hypothetical protein